MARSLQYVLAFGARAWHAGRGRITRERSRLQRPSRSGIELEGADQIAYTEAQYRSLAQLIVALCAAYPTLSRASTWSATATSRRRARSGPGTGVRLVARAYGARGLSPGSPGSEPLSAASAELPASVPRHRCARAPAAAPARTADPDRRFKYCKEAQRGAAVRSASAARQRPAAALGPAADRTRHMAGSRGCATPRQHEFLQWRQSRIEAFARCAPRATPRVPASTSALRARDRQLAAEIEQIVLNLDQACPGVGGDRAAPPETSSAPSALLSSSTAPMASMRGASLGTRVPSPRPVVPSSPVRVTILDRRWPMAATLLQRGRPKPSARHQWKL